MDKLKSIENAVFHRVYGNGRGWSFSRKDFATLGEHRALSRALNRLMKMADWSAKLEQLLCFSNLVQVIKRLHKKVI